MLAHVYRMIVYHCVGAPGHGREVVDGLNATNKSIISMLMENVQLPGAYDLFQPKMSCSLSFSGM